MAISLAVRNTIATVYFSKAPPGMGFDINSLSKYF
jgi:hypothetical protein